jgi:plastocyanin
MGAAQDAGPVVSTPTVSAKTTEPKAQTDPFADLANKVKQEAPVVKQEAPVVKQEAPVVKQEAPVVKQEAPVVKEEKMKEPAGPQTHKVVIPAGTAVPGCESDNACFTPASITIKAGDTVTWNNVDTAAHTVTGGSPADGPSGVFDSSLLMGGADYAFTFNDKGSYKYFCMVHPWMTGSVTVN